MNKCKILKIGRKFWQNRKELMYALSVTVLGAFPKRVCVLNVILTKFIFCPVRAGLSFIKHPLGLLDNYQSAGWRNTSLFSCLITAKIYEPRRNISFNQK